MRKLLVAFGAMLWLSTIVMAEVKQASLPIVLICPEIIELELITEKVELIPGPEDYARDSIMRKDVVELELFSNASNGAELHTYGVQPAELNNTGQLTNVLRLEDVHLKVNKDHTYIVENQLEGVNVSGDVTLPGLLDNWVRLSNEANELMRVNVSTKAKRRISIDIAITSLARYTTGSYKCTVWFSLIPRVA